MYKRQTLVVPDSALRFDQALPYVLVLEAGQAQQRSVATGARGTVLIDGRSEPGVEIVQGLQPGACLLYTSRCV